MVLRKKRRCGWQWIFLQPRLPLRPKRAAKTTEQGFAPARPVKNPKILNQRGQKGSDKPLESYLWEQANHKTPGNQRLSKAKGHLTEQHNNGQQERKMLDRLGGADS